MFARLAGRFLTGCKPEILQCKAMRRDKKEVLPALRTLTAYATLNFLSRRVRSSERTTEIFSFAPPEG